MEQRPIKKQLTAQSGPVLPTLPMCMVLAVDAAARDGGLLRAPWTMRVVVEQIEARLAAMPSRFFADARRPGRGVVDSRIQPMISELLGNGFLQPMGVGAAAVWVVDESRRDEIERLWRSLPLEVEAAVRAAAQRALAIAIALSKTARPAGESRTAMS